MDLTRPTSAPPAFLGEDAQVPDDIAPDDLRLSPAYYKFYYSQRPLDPRLPPPLVRYSREEGAAKQRLAFDCSPLGPGLLPEKPKLSPLEMIQSDFPRTSSPIYLSSSEDKVYVPSKSTVPSSYQPVGRQSPAITRSPLSNAFGATLTSCSSSSSSISSLEASIVHPALSRPVDIASGLQALSIDDEETTAPCTLSRAASEDNFVRHFSTRRSSVPSLSTPFGYSQPSAQYPSISPMMAVMGGYSQSRDSLSSCFQSQGPGAFEQLGRPGSEGFVDYSRASESDAYFESSYWDSRYVQHRGAFTEGNIEHIERRGHRNRSRRASASSDTGTRHVLLQELRSNKNVDLDEVIAQCVVAEFAIDQNGSRYIQQSLEGATAQQKELLFEQLSLEILNLCVDVFGNYVIQKFLELGLPSHRAVLADTLVGNVLALSLQMYGCRVIQKALEVIPRDMQVLLVKELDGHVLKCVKDQNGNHVIQKVIERIPAENIDFIVNAFTGNVFSLSTHAYGCRVIQRLLEYCSEEQKVVDLSMQVLIFLDSNSRRNS